MKQIIINNLHNVFFVFSGLFLVELIYKYYQLKNYSKYNNKYNNLYIEINKIFQIEMYKKDFIKFKTIHFNKSNSLIKNNYDIIQSNIPYLKFNNSITFVIKDNDLNADFNNYDVFNNLKYINPKIYLFYNNNDDDIFKIIIKEIKNKQNNKKNIDTFVNLINTNKNNKNIKYKVINSGNAYCIYDDKQLIGIGNDRSDILKKSIESEQSYVIMCLIGGIFSYYYLKK